MAVFFLGLKLPYPIVSCKLVSGTEQLSVTLQGKDTTVGEVLTLLTCHNAPLYIHKQKTDEIDINSIAEFDQRK